MSHCKNLAIGAATAVLALIPAAAASAAGPKVNVRVEGASKTLLQNTPTQTTSAAVTRFGAPAGQCPGSSAAGALDVATSGNWVATYSKSFKDYFVTGILGENYSSTAPTYWGFWINYHFSSTGVCKTLLHSGDQVLFAADSVAHHEFPLQITVSGSKKVGHKLKVKVVWYSDAGVAKPLAGVKVTVGKRSATTNSRGIAKLKLRKPGTLTLHATKTGYIRAAAVKVRVKS